MKRHEIQVLRNAGVTGREVEAITGASRRTIQRIAAEPPVADGAGDSKARVGRPSKVEGFRGAVAEILSKEPDLPTVEVLHRVRQKGYTGGKSAVYDLVAAMRSPSSGPIVRFEGLPGEFSQHDFGSVVVRYICGRQERVHFFASRLKYARWSYVEVVADETVESLVRALLNSFEDFGGVPLVAVFDRPKTVVLRTRGEKIEWNSTFGQVALDYRFAPELCAPARGNQKGAVENLVGWVKKSFFSVRRFHDREDLLAQLREWLREGNETRPSRATGVVPLARMDEERQRLRPLPIRPSHYPLRFPVVVGPTGVVEHQKIRYSMPPEAIGFPGTLYLYRDRVRIVARKHEVEHPRYPECGSTSIHEEHRSAMLASVSGRRGRLYFKRQQLLELGRDAELFLTEVVHRQPRGWPGEVECLFELLQEVGGQRLISALSLLVSRRLFGARFVREHLQKGIG